MTDRATHVDLLSELPNTEKRAGGRVEDAIGAALAGPEGDRRPSIVLRAPARVTWTLHLPKHARWQSAVWGRGQVRVGLSNGRSYHEVGQQTATTSWTPLNIDLREYSEWKLSVFHQPLRTEWKIIVNADATAPNGESRLALDRPLLSSATSR